MAISYNRALFTSASLASSVYTSNAVLITDWQQIGVQVPSLASAQGSRFSFDVSDADNPTVEADWTFYSQTTGVSQLTAGHRWLRCRRSAVDSQGSVYVNGASNW